jgi:hypothetical protein
MRKSPTTSGDDDDNKKSLAGLDLLLAVAAAWCWNVLFRCSSRVIIIVCHRDTTNDDAGEYASAFFQQKIADGCAKVV